MSKDQIKALEQRLNKMASSLPKPPKQKKKKKKSSGGSFPVAGSSSAGPSSFGPLQTAPVSQGRFFRFAGRKRGEVHWEGSMKVPKRELVMTVLGSDDGLERKASFLINPGNSELFPRLSKVAQEYEQYHFPLLRFEYEPTCSSNNEGSVIYSIEYTSTNPYPTDEKSAVDKYDSCQGNFWGEMWTNLDPAAMFPIGPRKIIDNSPVAIGDRSTKDAGRLDVYTDGGGQDGRKGKLYVVYACALHVPILGIPAAPANLYASRFFVLTGPGDQIYPDVTSTAIQFKTATDSVNPSGIASNALGLLNLDQTWQAGGARARSIFRTPASQNFFFILTLTYAEQAGALTSAFLSAVLSCRWSPSNLPDGADAGTSGNQISSSYLRFYNTATAERGQQVVTGIVALTANTSPPSGGNLWFVLRPDSADGSGVVVSYGDLVLMSI